MTDLVQVVDRLTSEFGAGIVVCLAKFSGHLENEMRSNLFAMVQWIEASPEKRLAWRGEASIKQVGERFATYLEIWKTPERVLSHQISIWMNGASDHLYGLDRLRAPKPLIELADLALEMGHGFMMRDKIYTMKDVEKIFELWQASCLAVDKMLRTEPDWGTW